MWSSYELGKDVWLRDMVLVCMEADAQGVAASVFEVTNERGGVGVASGRSGKCGVVIAVYRDPRHLLQHLSLFWLSFITRGTLLIPTPFVRIAPLR